MNPDSRVNQTAAPLDRRRRTLSQCRYDASRAGCTVELDDPDFPRSGRGAAYYVRALQEPTRAINGANLRTRFDRDGNALTVEPCYGDYRTRSDDDCLAPVAERAWSSPICSIERATSPSR